MIYELKLGMYKACIAEAKANKNIKLHDALIARFTWEQDDLTKMEFEQLSAFMETQSVTRRGLS